MPRLRPSHFQRPRTVRKRPSVQRSGPLRRPAAQPTRAESRETNRQHIRLGLPLRLRPSEEGANFHALASALSSKKTKWGRCPRCHTPRRPVAHASGWSLGKVHLRCSHWFATEHGRRDCWLYDVYRGDEALLPQS